MREEGEEEDVKMKEETEESEERGAEGGAAHPPQTTLHKYQYPQSWLACGAWLASLLRLLLVPFIRLMELKEGCSEI